MLEWPILVWTVSVSFPEHRNSLDIYYRLFRQYDSTGLFII